ncbi:hypothetical protein PAECIP111802_06550 [Paenibacillus allorhizosphaerae]|uniref:Uncharacterized protein n=1 Tax=Paenibacillus allorhizosphaerae TaxID=2849866 RepID=A0ABN7TY75_9BACL|nr:hypothetical protein PAECIP111802_06550 [Paenibacillus allorhizosphaerae]
MTVGTLRLFFLGMNAFLSPDIAQLTFFPLSGYPLRTGDQILAFAFLLHSESSILGGVIKAQMLLFFWLPYFELVTIRVIEIELSEPAMYNQFSDTNTIRTGMLI